MNTVEFVNVPKAEDSDKAVFVNGERLGTVCKGWLRNGGDQWVFSGLNLPTFGEPTLKGLKREVTRRLGQ